MGWWPNTSDKRICQYLWSHIIPFQSALQYNVIQGLLLSYQYRIFCIENYSTFSLPHFFFFSLFFFFFFFFYLNESTAELAADISIHFIFPDWEQLLSFICNSIFGTLSKSTFRWMAHIWSPYNKAVLELWENTVLLWLHDNSVSMFTFNTLPLSFVIWCFPQH